MAASKRNTMPEKLNIDTSEPRQAQGSVTEEQQQ